MKHQIYHKLEPQLQNKMGVGYMNHNFKIKWVLDTFHVLQPFVLILFWVSKCTINHLNTTTVPTAKTT